MKTKFRHNERFRQLPCWLGLRNKPASHQYNKSSYKVPFKVKRGDVRCSKREEVVFVAATIKYFARKLVAVT